MLILLPPSEGKSGPRRGKPLDLGSMSFPDLTAPRATVLEALVTLCDTDQPEVAAQVLGLGKTQIDAVRRNAGLKLAPAARADSVYSGVLYDALDLSTLDSAARRRATTWLAVTSALFGLLRPTDRIPAYRLAGDVSLPGIGSMSTYWSRHLDRAVRAAAGRGLVVDLRSSTYKAFWRPDSDLDRRVVTLRVLHEHQGERKIVSHFNKATKGRIVRALAEDRAAPATVDEMVLALRDLKLTVEEQPAVAGRPRQLDVVVTEL